MVYLDNAATTFPKPKAVIDEVKKCIGEYCGNPGRSGHKLSITAAERIYEAREKLALHFGYSKPENIVFTYNATYALNIAMWAKIPPNSHVLCSDIEHNAVIRPLNLLKEKGIIDYSLFSSEGNIAENIKRAMTPKTKAIVSTLCSNVTGKRIFLKTLSGVAREHGLILIVDASQSAGHDTINLAKTPCDCLCAPGHKGLFGIQGAGFIVFGGRCPEPIMSGGSGSNSKSPFMPTELPESHEPGTLSTPSIVGLLRGVEFIDSVGIDEIRYKEKLLCDKIKTGLSVIKGIKLYDTDGSIILFNVEGKEEYFISSRLDRYGICVRGGFHCAPSAHIKLGTEATGAIRLSVSYLNSLSDADYFLKSITKIMAEI